MSFSGVNRSSHITNTKQVIHSKPECILLTNPAYASVPEISAWWCCFNICGKERFVNCFISVYFEALSLPINTRTRINAQTRSLLKNTASREKADHVKKIKVIKPIIGNNNSLYIFIVLIILLLLMKFPGAH